MKKKYSKPKIQGKKVNAVFLRRKKTHLDSYNELEGLLIATFPGCGHSCDTGSDRRLKKNIKPLPKSLEKIKKLTPVTFDWINQTAKKGNIGFIAQDMEKLYPEVVFTDERGYKNIDYSKLTAVLVKGIQELTERIAELEKKSGSSK